jgi:YD repeat-containing protein
MKALRILRLTAAGSLLACGSDRGTTAPSGPPPPPPPRATALLKDIVIPNLPSPYYHFAYDTEGRVNAASFASDFLIYDVVYAAGRISEMRTNILVNNDQLKYTYDGEGRVVGVDEVDPDNGVVFTRLVLSYVGQKLVNLERRRRLNSGAFVSDKTMSFAYYADGNLMQLTEHRPALNGQPETTTIDRFENYDDGMNVDAFGLIHDDFFDHLVLLPGVLLQKSNPLRQVRTGDGENFTVDFTYTYDGNKRPLSKRGDALLSTGPNAGRRFQTSAIFSYY